MSRAMRLGELRLLDERWRTGYRARRMAEFADRCRQSGLAVTPQRLAIIRALLDSGDHPRAEEVYARVRRRQPHISLATVHRTLETLCAAGEAHKVTLLHDSARYDGNVSPHHHVICTRCRRIRDVEVPEFDNLLGAKARIGEFELLGLSVEIYALCRRCRTGGPRRRRHLN